MRDWFAAIAISRGVEMSTKTKFRIPPRSRFRGLRLDPEIVELIIELNKAGFSTYMSCAGHRSMAPSKGMLRGFIGFKRCNDKEGIVKILEAYGLRNIRIEDQIEDADPDFYYRGKATVVSFDPIGEPRAGGDDIIDQLDNERQLELF